MDKQLLNPAGLAKPSGYSHGVLTSGGRLLFLAGQPGTDANGQILAPDDLVAQFSQALSNLSLVVAAAGGRMTDIVKLSIFVTDKVDYKAHLEPIGAVYRGYFGNYYPAITLGEIESLFDDGALIEIEGIAVIE
jgi:enamine deaminase RidA (YjgF/YER057c/UK114 family)